MTAYYMLLTATGQAKVAAHLAGGATVNLTQMALGDGGGAPVTPTEGRAALYNEVHRQALSSVTVDPENPNWLVAETVLAPEVGGWTIREMGLYDDADDLIAYGNFPASYKPVLAEGSAKELIIRAVFEVSDTAAITLLVDASVVYATQSWVNAQSFASQTWVNAQGFATQTWVNAQGFATQTWVNAQGFATQTWVNAQGFAKTASNLGSGAGQAFAGKVGADLQFRSLKAGSNVTITQNGTEITISAAAPSGGEANTASNLGSGEGVYGAKVGVDLRFKSIKAGANATISSTANEITVNPKVGTTTNTFTGVQTATGFAVSSDRRLKDAIRPLCIDASRLDAIHLYEWCWNELSGREGQADSGVLADEVAAVFPSCVYTGEDGYQRVDYGKLAVHLILTQRGG